MFKILEKYTLNENTKKMIVDAPLIAKKAMPGQFIIFKVDEFGERVPLTISDYDRDKGTITIVFQEVGGSTKELGKLNVGDSIMDFVGPLGNPSHLEEYKNACVIGGGLGSAIAFPQAKRLHKLGAKVDIIAGFRNTDFIILEEEMKEVCDNLYITTDDGSNGKKGFVTDVLKEQLKTKKYDLVIAIGPLIMMKFVSLLTKEYGIKTIVSMNSIMIDGTGMCGGCRLTVGNETKFACVDGPDFDGHLVDFDQAMKRQQVFKRHDNHACKMDGKTNG